MMNVNNEWTERTILQCNEVKCALNESQISSFFIILTDGRPQLIEAS